MQNRTEVQFCLFVNGKYDDVILSPKDDIIIDRFGGNYGTFFGEEGTPIEMKAMSPNSDFDTYHKYKVTKELPVRKGTIQILLLRCK